MQLPGGARTQFKFMLGKDESSTHIFELAVELEVEHLPLALRRGIPRCSQSRPNTDEPIQAPKTLFAPRMTGRMNEFLVTSQLRLRQRQATSGGFLRKSSRHVCSKHMILMIHQHPLFTGTVTPPQLLLLRTPRTKLRTHRAHTHTQHTLRALKVHPLQQ